MAAAVQALQKRSTKAVLSSSSSLLATPANTQRSPKFGFADLEASWQNESTRLTRISHQAPARCIPLLSSSSTKSAAQVCALSSYGGGLVDRDCLEYRITVQPRATLAVTTQGAQRIYKRIHKNDDDANVHGTTTDSSTEMSQTRFAATVQSEGLLVVAPDPVSLFANSRYRQVQSVHLQDSTASLCWIDWFSAGRFQANSSSSERWQYERLEAHTTLTRQDDLLVRDATVLENDGSRHSNSNNNTIDWGQHAFQAYASMILHAGSTPQAAPIDKIVQNCYQLQNDLLVPYTRTRRHPAHAASRNDNDDVSMTHWMDSLSGRAVVGVNECVPYSSSNDNTADARLYMVRLAATSNEDMYRLFHACLQPLAPVLGLELYQDRIRSRHSAPVAATTSVAVSSSYALSSSSTTASTTTANSIQYSPTAHWRALILADSALPVGSFAHSAGLEAAHQSQLLGGHCASFIRVATQSAVRLATPWIRAGHGSSAAMLQDLHRRAHASYASNEMACRASLDQGRSLLRVALQTEHFQKQAWMQDDINNSTTTGGVHHLAPLWGRLTAALDVGVEESCHLFGYCVARDLVSAAVRLGLVGPLASVDLLAQTQQAVQQGMDAAAGGTTSDAAGCAPIVDAVQPCHNILSTRLFRT